MQRLSAITHVWFGLFRVRSPLLTESRLFSFPVGTEMFHFPTFPPTALCVQAEVAGHYSGFFRGFPIRKSPDRSSFTRSEEHTSELQSRLHLVCRLLLEKKKCP